MKKSCFLVLIFFIFLTGCNKEITEEDLMGKWVGTASYEDGKISGEPNCYPFHVGIEFKDEETVYVDEKGRDLTYSLDEFDKGQVIDFYDANGMWYTYYIMYISENEIALKGEGRYRSDQSCYLEKQS